MDPVEKASLLFVDNATAFDTRVMIEGKERIMMKML